MKFHKKNEFFSLFLQKKYNKLIFKNIELLINVIFSKKYTDEI